MHALCSPGSHGAAGITAVEPPPLLVVAMSSASLPQLLCDQLRQRCQPPYADNEAGIVEVLRALQTCGMTVELLQSTRVGVLLNAVRRELSEDGAALAKQLIAQWKEAARSAAAAGSTVAASSAAAQAVLPVPAAAAAAVAAAGRSVSVPARSASDALRASSERRKRKAAALTRSLSPQPAARPTYTSISDLPPSAFTQHALSPAKAATHHSDSATHSLPLHNPNHHSQRLQTAAVAGGQSGEASQCERRSGGEDEDDMDDASAENRADELDLTAKRKRQHTTDVDMADSALPLPTSPVAVCSLQQMCIDHLAQPAVVNQLGSLPPLPQPVLLAILQRASVDCLRRVQAASGWLKETDLDELWHAAAVRRWGQQTLPQHAQLSSSATPQRPQQSTSSWRALYERREKEQESRLSQLGLRLKARVESERREKKEKQAIKHMDIQQATRQLEKRGKKHTAAGEGGGSGGISRTDSHGHSAVTADRRADKSVNRLSALRKESGGQSQRFWSARPND